MTDQIREQISALLDGELARDELGLLVRRMERDAELRRAFGNYVLIGECLRSPGDTTATRTFATRVGAAIGDVPGREVVDDAAGAARPRRWARPAVASAIAASLAIAGAALLRPSSEVGVPSVASNVEANGDPATEMPTTSAATPTLEQSQRLASYLVAHSQFSSPLGRRAVLMNVIAEDPGLERTAFQTIEAP
jgi:sigma-E factor negative regulatory protein RseA